MEEKTRINQYFYINIYIYLYLSVPRRRIRDVANNFYSVKLQFFCEYN